MLPLPRPSIVSADFSFQETAVRLVLDALNRHQSVLLQAPTGAGKTRMAIELARQVEGPVLFLAESPEIIGQTVAAYRALGLPVEALTRDRDTRHGAFGMFGAQFVVMAQRTGWSRGVRAKHDLGDYRTIIIDECHHIRAPTYKALLNLWPDAKQVGLTATPVRGDGRGLGNHFKALIQGDDYEGNYSHLTEKGVLVPCPRDKVWTWPMDMRGVRKQAGDYVMGGEKGAAKKMDVPKLIGDIVEHHRKLAGDRPTIVYASSVAHAEHIEEAFREAGVEAGTVHAGTSKDDREGVLEALAGGRCQVVCNYGVLTEGFDCLDAETEVLTDQGWVGRLGMTLEHRVANWHEGAIRFLRPDRIIDREALSSESMVRFKSLRHDFRVTGRHMMVVRPRRHKSREPWRKVDAASLPASTAFDIPVAGYEIGHPQSDLSLDECRLIGFWLGDGSRNGSKLELYQSDRYPDIVEWIESLLRRLGYDFRHRKRRQDGPGRYVTAFDGNVWTIPLGGRGGKLQRNGYRLIREWFDKDGSPRLKALSREQFRALIDGLFMADGQHNERRVMITSGNKTLFDRLQAIAVCRGFAARVRTVHREDGNDYYWFSMWDRDVLSMNNRGSGKHAEAWSVSAPQPGERVWCVEAETGIIITRRNGVVSVVGNCPPVSCIVLARRTDLIGLYVQMVGRGLRASPGKVDLMLQDHAGNVPVHGLPGEDLHWRITEDSKAAVKREKRAAVPCPECNAVLTYDGSCGACGWRPKRPLFPEHPNGRLREHASDDHDLTVNLVRLSDDRAEDIKADMSSPKRAEYMKLLGLARKKGWKEGWASYRYKERFGDWPDIAWSLPNPTKCEPAQYLAAARALAERRGFKPGWADHRFRETYGEMPR